MRNRSTLVMLAITGSLLVVGACHKQSEPAPDNGQVETPAPVTQTPVAAPEAPTPPVPKPVKTKVKETPKPTADQQMIDDADATGMTSHTAPDADSTGSTGNSQP